MLVMYKGFKLIINNELKTVEIRTNDLDKQDKLKKHLEELESSYKDYSFYITLDKKTTIDGKTITEITKLSNHVNQNLKTILYLVECESKKTKKGYATKLLFEVPNKRLCVKGFIFKQVPINLKTGKYYQVEGRLTESNSTYIKKSEQKLGKEKDYVININDIAEIEIENKTKEHHEISRAELHCHTMYSKNDGLSTPEDYLKAFETNKCHAIAITDHGVTFAFIPFVNKLKGKTDKKLILGCEFYTVSNEQYILDTQEKIKELESKDFDYEIDKINFQIEEQQNNLSTIREERDKYKRFASRKTITQEERAEATENMILKMQELEDCNKTIKELKQNIKILEIDKIKTEKELEKLRKDLNGTDNIERDHFIVLLKSPDEVIDYKGEPLTINPGLVKLYELITKSYKEYFSSPTDEDKKMYGKRPVLPYKELFDPEVRKYFVYSSACAFGKHMKLIVQDKEEEFREWIRKLDAVEIQPSWNNSFMVEHKDYPNITCIEDVYKLHRRVYDICKEENVPCIIVSDAHVSHKDDRELRSVFKNGYISLLANSYGKPDEQRSSTDEDFSIDTQPYIMSYEDVIEDYTKQGFTKEEIEEMHDNTNKLADSCANAFDITILPDKLFIPDYPGINPKEEMPKLAWEFAINKWSTDGTKEGINEKIRKRLEEEIELTADFNYEILYMLARFAVIKSEEKGYIVGSRGSVGSMLLSYCLKISEVLPLESHYYCEHCHHVEWHTEKGKVGPELETKKCPVCGNDMYGDGYDIEAHNFVGWIERDEQNRIKPTKVPDCDLNLSENVQLEVQQEYINMFGEENVIKSGTQMEYGQDALINDIFRNIPRIEEKVQAEEFDIEYMSRNIHSMRTSGSHPGGMLIKPAVAKFEYVTPQVFVSDNPNKAELSSSWVYHNIEANLVKMDLLGHSDPTMLKELEEFTGYDFRNVKFNDRELIDGILDTKYLNLKDGFDNYPFVANTMGISEMNTDFAMQTLRDMKIDSMYALIASSALLHGTAVLECQRQYILEGYKLEDLVTFRDIIFQQLTYKYGFEPKTAFLVSENVRKGKGIEKFKKELLEKCPNWYVEILDTIKYLFPETTILRAVQ